MRTSNLSGSKKALPRPFLVGHLSEQWNGHLFQLDVQAFLDQNDQGHQIRRVVGVVERQKFVNGV